MNDEKFSEEIFGEGINKPSGKVTSEEKEFINETLVEAGLADQAPEFVKLTKEQVLKSDMVRLNGFNDDIEDNQNRLNSIQKNIEEFLTDEGLDKLQSDLLEKKIQLKKDYGLLKDDIGERGLAIHKKTDNTDPAPGVKLKKHDNRELIVDPVAAIEWAIAKELVTFLILDEGKYADQLELGTMKDQPGELDKTPIYKASISLKPYQDK